MSLIILFSVLNLIGLILAQLNVWRPISFQKLQWFNANYASGFTFPIFIYVAIKWVKVYKLPPTKTDISHAVYTDDYVTMIKREYLFNLCAFILYQILIAIFS